MVEGQEAHTPQNTCLRRKARDCTVRASIRRLQGLQLKVEESALIQAPIAALRHSDSDALKALGTARF